MCRRFAHWDRRETHRRMSGVVSVGPPISRLVQPQARERSASWPVSRPVVGEGRQAIGSQQQVCLGIVEEHPPEVAHRGCLITDREEGIESVVSRGGGRVGTPRSVMP
jgi:hypothetical protein